MGYTYSQAKEFINRIAPMMQAEAQKRGYRIVSTAIAQGIIEGAAGTSKLARDYHNHWGLKCGKSWKGASVNMKTKEEYTAGTLTTIKDNFRAYSSDEEGIRGYYDFISTSRYANLKTATTPLQYAQFLKQDGYATSSSYVNTLTSTVNKYDLKAYDVFSSSQVLPVLRKGSRGEAVKSWQTYLNSHGFCCGNTDGIFGEKTKQAVIAYQKFYGLVPDGIIGPKTWNSIPAIAAKTRVT